MRKLLQALLSLLLIFSINQPAFADITPSAYTPYPTQLAEVGTRASVQDSKSTSFKQSNSRSIHYARDDISYVKIGIANWFVGPGAPEVGSGSTMTATAQIEYPVGTCTRITFNGGNTTATIPDDKTGWSDYVPVTVKIPRGAAYYVRKWESTTSAIVFNTVHGIDLANGETFNYGTTVPDETPCGSSTNASGNTTNSSQPVAILTYTNRPAVCIEGDSRAGGQKDTISNNGDDVGEFARAIGPYYAYINLAASGDRASLAITGNNYANRLELAQYCTHMLVNYGVNDLYAGDSAATVWSHLQTFYSLFPGKPIIQATIYGEDNSNDNYTSLAGQTMANVAYNGQRVILDQLLRAVPYPLTGVVDDAASIENSLDSGLWNTAGSVQVTAGTYTSATGAFSLTTAANHNIQLGENFYIYLNTTGSPSPYRSFATATAVPKGTGSGYVTSSAGYAVGSTNIALTTGTGTILAGDAILFAGDPTPYVVSTGISAPGTVTLAAPGLTKALPASAVSATVTSSPTTLNFTGATGLGITAILGGAVNSRTFDGTHPTPVGYLGIAKDSAPLLRAIIGGRP